MHRRRNGFGCNLSLYFIAIENCRTVLATSVVALPVLGGWIMDLEEESQNVAHTGYVGVVDNFDGLCMSCRAGFYLEISCLRASPPGVPHSCLHDAGLFSK